MIYSSNSSEYKTVYSIELTKEEIEICKDFGAPTDGGLRAFVDWFIIHGGKDLLKSIIENNKKENQNLFVNKYKEYARDVLNYLHLLSESENKSLGDNEKYKKIKNAISKVEESVQIIIEAYTNS